MNVMRKIWTRSSSYLYTLQEKPILNRLGFCLAHTQTEKPEDEPAKPVKYSKSKAATWKAEYTRTGGRQDHPWYQTYVVSGSLTVFLAYFCIFREENDIDEELGKSLYDRISGLEERQLEAALEYDSDHGHDTSRIEARLEDLKKK
ncbi:uncharacterized protein LOC110830277 [Zootermopsis nevadensis]|uniref:uncharacterized protein LOC110830277 n=1 Tax=Zootermopsis nevadensis TaxID=136037 RepID=UPI000B8E7DA3|nr:uncharacterized protein LOC110830277 [Zootermopsis nevadensis]